MSVRDSQRSKLYRAERVIYDRCKKFETLDEVERYIRSILGDAWLRKEFPSMMYCGTFDLKDGRGRRSACFMALNGWVEFSFPRWSRNEVVIIHEVAHWIMHQECKLKNIRYASHGPEFASAMSRLIHRRMGDETFRELTNSFRDHGVRYLWLQ